MSDEVPIDDYTMDVNHDDDNVCILEKKHCNGISLETQTGGRMHRNVYTVCKHYLIASHSLGA